MREHIEHVIRHSAKNIIAKAEITESDSFEGLSEITCPFCGENYVHHIDETLTLNGRDNYEASGAAGTRGSVIAIPMYCEHGHYFALCLGFHKGCIAVWYVSLPAPLPQTDDEMNRALGL